VDVFAYPSYLYSKFLEFYMLLKIQGYGLAVLIVICVALAWVDYQNSQIIKVARDNFSYGKFDLAFSQLGVATSRISIDAEAWLLLGRVSTSAALFRSDKKYSDLAVTYLQKAVALEPNQAANYLHLGVALQIKQQNQLAREALLNALARDPYNGNYLYNYGLLLERQGQFSQAALYYQKSLTVRESLVVQLALERVQKAIR
jgi:tetratricopeptide (TPR) repeat protein